MKRSTFRCFTEVSRRGAAQLPALLCLLTLSLPAAAQSPVPLADQPIFATQDVPGNLALTLSVEYPTAISVANLNDYADGSTYYGYFDPVKCYTYQYNSTTPSSSYFQASAFATGTNLHSCSGAWSGNFMNWATMQTIDPFRWALTGGYRSVDTTSQTILEKAWGSSDGNTTNFPYRGTGQSTGHNLSTSLIGSVTPFSNWTAFNSAIWSNGNAMVFSQGSGYTSGYTSSSVGDLSSVSDINKSSSVRGGYNVNNGYRVFVRVSVCDTSVLGTAGLESNCVGYGTASTSNGTTTYSTYKPQGLMQQYSNRIRFAALSFLYGSGQTNQGGVLREPMGYIGPTYPTPLSSTVTTNTRAEWDPNTGIMKSNPDTTTATASSVTQSGVMNYVNQFGESSHHYMLYDNVSELYYATLRYFENLGNVPEWVSGVSTTSLDGFPAVTNWTDPILYRCQKNFILGIGDDHTWYDYNVGGGSVTGTRAKPALVTSDTTNLADTWTANLEKLEGFSSTTYTWPFDSGATYYIAGLAYGAHVLDIRPDLADTQTISTYWVDVMEYQRAENLNPYYLAAKYGGFAVPTNYSMSNTTALTQSWWDTTGNNINMNGHTHPLPDNYFPAGSAGTMVSSLTNAFKNIANSIQSFTNSFSLSTPVVASAGENSFSSQYNSSNWTGIVTGSTLTLDSTGLPTLTQLWISSTTLENQLAGTGWQNSRSVATWNGSKGVAFEPTAVTSTQLSALSPSSYASSSTTSTMVLNYLRGDRTNEAGSTASGSTKSLRTRSLLLGDIVDAALAPVGPPSMSYSDSHNPGYSTFKSTWTNRPVMVYAAANDGMVHAFVGSTGVEQFAYVPSALFQGPTSTPQVNGLAALANPNYAHVNYVDATPRTADLDLNNSGGSTSSTTDWETMLIGGLGKGGMSYYALKVTNPANMNVESTLANQVAWEFTDSTMGYSFGAPIVAKTAKYGWVVVLTSGYDNSDGYGYLYFVNPSSGALLEKVKTPKTSSGLVHATGYTQDATDYTLDAIYAGDLNGQLWRFDVTSVTGSYPAPTQIASLTDASGNAQPITTDPVIAVHPTTRMRYVMVGTGRMLASQDVASTASQTFYVIVDGTNSAFNKAISTPVTRTNLTAVTSLLNGISGPPTTTGWYYDMTGSGERVIIDPVIYSGFVAWASLLPSTDPCSPSGTSNVYGVNFATGQTVLTNVGNSATAAASYSVSYAVNNLEFVSGPSGVELIAGDTKGDTMHVPGNLNGSITTRLLNWTEIPTVQ